MTCKFLSSTGRSCVFRCEIRHGISRKKKRRKAMLSEERRRGILGRRFLRLACWQCGQLVVQLHCIYDRYRHCNYDYRRSAATMEENNLEKSSPRTPRSKLIFCNYQIDVPDSYILIRALETALSTELRIHRLNLSKFRPLYLLLTLTFITSNHEYSLNFKTETVEPYSLSAR